jgi:opacity protein-like surface antigen
MRKLSVVLGAVLFLFVSVRSSLAAPCSSEVEAPGVFVPSEGCITLGVGYQFQHFHTLDTTFNDQAYDVSAAIHLFDLITGAGERLTAGLEGEVSAGFGGKTSSTASSLSGLDAKSLFVGAGPRLALPSTSRFEPWVHGLVGLQHFRFTQSSLVGSNSALGFIVGGGVDIRVAPRLSWRLEANYVGTTFGAPSQSYVQSQYSAGTGLVLNF